MVQPPRRTQREEEILTEIARAAQASQTFFGLFTHLMKWSLGLAMFLWSALSVFKWWHDGTPPSAPPSHMQGDD